MSMTVIIHGHIHGLEIVGYPVGQQEVLTDVLLGVGGFLVFQEVDNMVSGLLRGLVKITGITIPNLKRDGTDIRCYDGFSFPESLGNDETKPFPCRWLHDNVGRSLKCIDLLPVIEAVSQ